MVFIAPISGDESGWLSIVLSIYCCNCYDIDHQAERHFVLQVHASMMNGYLWQSKAHCRTELARVSCVAKTKPMVLGVITNRAGCMFGRCFLM